MLLLKRLFVVSLFSITTSSLLNAAPLLNGDPCWTWNGFYAGINLGIIRCYDRLTLTPKGLWGTESAALQDFIEGNGTTRLSNWNFVGGGQIGYNYQFRCWLSSIEIDGNYLNLSDHRRTAQLRFPPLNLLDYGFHDQIEHNWLATARARFGRVFQTRFMAYLTGGYATGNVKASSQIYSADTGYQSFASGSKTLHGWTLGGGLEYAIRPHFTIRGEYLYIHLGKFQTTSTPLPLFAGYFEERQYHIRHDAIRFGLNYRL